MHEWSLKVWTFDRTHHNSSGSAHSHICNCDDHFYNCHDHSRTSPSAIAITTVTRLARANLVTCLQLSNVGKFTILFSHMFQFHVCISWCIFINFRYCKMHFKLFNSIFSYQVINFSRSISLFFFTCVDNHMTMVHKNILEAYTDSNYVGNLDIWKSMSRYVFMHIGRAISWRSKL